MIKQNNIFWQDVLQSWLQVENILNKNHDYIKKFISSVPLWYNSLIIPEDHIFFIKTWYQNGIKLISDFLNDNGSFMSYDEFLNNYNLPNVYMMQFNGIISAISKFLKSVSVEKACIKKTYYPFIPMYFDTVLLN